MSKLLAAAALLTALNAAALAAQPAREAQVKALLDKVQALTALSRFEPANVAKALALPDVFEETSRGDAFNIWEAALSSGPIRRVELRVGAESERVTAIVEVDPALAIGPEEITERFGTRYGVSGPPVHAPEGSPYDYVYRRPGGRLRLRLKPGQPDVLQSAVWSSLDKGR